MAGRKQGQSARIEIIDNTGSWVINANHFNGKASDLKADPRFRLLTSPRSGLPIDYACIPAVGVAAAFLDFNIETSEAQDQSAKTLDQR